NLGTAWQLGSINLSTYIGQIINVRFRGITGPDYTSDMAIDDINIYDTSAPPAAAFSVSPSNICVNQTVTLNDLSSNLPTSWSWSLTPNTGFTFTNGTTASSQNPVIQFTSNGVYDIQLTVTNNFGSGSTTQTAAVSVGIASTLPVVETFQAPVFPPANWNIDNPDNSITWSQSTSITGIDGNPTIASLVDNFNYNAAGQEDGMLTERINLNGVSTGFMTFDVAHARYSAAYEDALRIDISTDCGATFIPSGYFKQGSALATVADQTTLFAPTNSASWRKDTLDLSGYVNSDIIVKFVNITGYGNSLYIDNINVDLVSGINGTPSVYSGISVFPNPGSGIFNLDVMMDRSSDIQVLLMDAKGAIVIDHRYSLVKGLNRKQLDLTGFNKGVYQLRVNDGQSTKTIKLVVI
ncbi:MAG: T9SS type A sorting domain-containing protein, partial [Bacteroidota bacterium]